MNTAIGYHRDPGLIEFNIWLCPPSIEWQAGDPSVVAHCILSSSKRLTKWYVNSIVIDIERVLMPQEPGLLARIQEALDKQCPEFKFYRWGRNEVCSKGDLK